MATTVTYKGQVLVTVDNSTKVLETSGTWCEDDFTLVDTGGGSGWTTDGIASRTEPNGDITISTAVATIKERVFMNCTGITGVTIDGDPFIENFAFNKCTNLETVNAPNVTKFMSNRWSTCANVFDGCSKLKGIVLPNFGNNVVDGYMFANCPNFIYADFNNMQRLGGSDVFRSSGINVLILRKTDGVVTLQTVDVFRFSPFASGYAGGTLYVPSAFISSYQSASNWSTILGYSTNSIQAIEGSQYENYYADGTPIS